MVSTFHIECEKGSLDVVDNQIHLRKPEATEDEGKIIDFQKYLKEG